MTDPERIYLEPGEGDPMEGRQWCQDNVWADDGMYDEEATAYVRGDLYDDLSDQLAKSEAENAELRKECAELRLIAAPDQSDRPVAETLAQIRNIVLREAPDGENGWGRVWEIGRLVAPEWCAGVESDQEMPTALPQADGDPGGEDV